MFTTTYVICSCLPASLGVANIAGAVLAEVAECSAVLKLLALGVKYIIKLYRQVKVLIITGRHITGFRPTASICAELVIAVLVTNSSSLSLNSSPRPTALAVVPWRTVSLWYRTQRCRCEEYSDDERRDHVA
jgi:hypothetical protein